MRRAGRICIAAGLIGAALWSGAWLAGRAVLSERMDTGLAALAAEGVTVEIGTREIGGFPFGYTARLSEVALSAADGTGVTLPDLSGGVSVTDPDRAAARFPPSFDVSLPAGGGTRRVAVESAGLILSAEGVTGKDRRARLTADRLSLTDATDGHRLDLIGLRGEARPPAGGTAPRGSTRIDRLDFSTLMALPAGGTARLTARLDGVRVEGETSFARLADLGRMLAGSSRAAGHGALVLSAAGLTLDLTVEGAGPADDGHLSIATGPLSARLGVDRGDMRAEAGIASLRLGLDAPGRALSGTLGTGPVEAVYAIPLGPTETLQPASLGLAIADAVPDAALWRALDREAALPREAMDLALDLSGSLRLTRPFAEARPGALPPIEPGTLTIERLHLSGLGAAAEAEGAVEFAPGGQAPTGEIRVTLDGALDLVRRLHAAGLIGQQSVQRLAVALASFTRPGADPGRLVSRIAFDDGALSVNGEPRP